MNWDHSVVFEIEPKYFILDYFDDYEDYSISYKGFLPTVVDTMFIWIKFIHFSLLIPKMSVLALAISCLTTFNLRWFMIPTFQIPMKYCSLRIWKLLSPSDTSTGGHHFQFGSASSLFLELFFCCSPVAYWTPSSLGACLMMSYPFAFHIIHGILKARTPKWVAIPFSSGQCFSSGKNTWGGSHSLLQGIFLTQGSNQSFPHFREILYCLSHQGSPKCSTWVQSQKRQNDLSLFSRHTIQHHGNPNLFPNH